MAYVNLWVAFLAIIQCSVISCYDVYTWKYEDDDRELSSLEKMDQFLAENRGISILIGAIINTTLLVILYWSIRLCCPTCCRKIRQAESKLRTMAIASAISTFLLITLYFSIKFCCPTSCSKRRKGIIYDVVDIRVPEVQPLTECSEELK